MVFTYTSLYRWALDIPVSPRLSSTFFSPSIKSGRFLRFRSEKSRRFRSKGKEETQNQIKTPGVRRSRRHRLTNETTELLEDPAEYLR